MSIVREDCDERQTRVDRMIDEFRKAQSRRFAAVTTRTGNDDKAELPRDALAEAAVAASAPAPTPH